MSNLQIKETEIIQNPNQTTAIVGERIVTKVEYWTDWLFSFRVTRPKSFRFRSGEFVQVGLTGFKYWSSNNGNPLLRAYSIASPNWDDELEFYSIIIPDGPLTSILKNVQVGDNVILKPKATGTLVLDTLRPGKRLFMFSSGTGIAPFASLIRDPETYEKFDQIILTHTCREVKELNYSKSIIEAIKDDPLIGKYVPEKLFYYPTVTREPFVTNGRITKLIETGQIFQDLCLEAFNPDTDRAMICGSMGLNKDIKKILEGYGLKEGANSRPAEFVLEKAFLG
tara:strand:- start:950 stop:1795 length:846 start_codon:yes stop_codon:yes gene_type:complete